VCDPPRSPSQGAYAQAHQRGLRESREDMGMSDLLIRGSARLMHIHPLVGSVSYFGLGLIQSSPDRPAVAEPGG